MAEDITVANPILDLGQWNQSISSMLADVNKIEQRIGNMAKASAVNVEFKASGDNTIQNMLDSFDAGVKAEVDFQTSDDNVVKKILDKADAGVTAEVDLDTTGERDVLSTLDQIKGKLETANRLAVIDLIFSVPEAFTSFANTLTSLPGVSTLIEMDTALAQLEGRTGRMIPGARELIVDLYTNAWGDSIEEVGRVVEVASRLGITTENLEQATKAAFDLEALGVGDAEENLRSLDSLVKNGLAPDYDSAADILATGFQTGADRGQDLLDTLNEYGSTFSQLRISGQGALSFINSGLRAGIDNSDRIADAIRETGIRLSEIHTDPNIAAAFEQLDNLSTIDLQAQLQSFEAGDINGDQFLGAFFQALQDANAADPSKAQTLAATLIGTIAEDFGIEAVSQLTPVWDESVFGPMEDRAVTASNAVNDTLGTALTELQRTIEVEIAGAVDSAFDLQGLIDKGKQAAKDFAQGLREGRGVGGALEFALQIPGLERTFNKLESLLTNLGITLLEVAANIGEFLGKNVEGLRAEVARLTAGQLAFDLKTADVEAIPGIIKQAIDRGVDDSKIGAAGQLAVQELVSDNDIARAKELAAALEPIASGEFIRSETAGGAGFRGLTESLADQGLIQERLFNTEDLQTTIEAGIQNVKDQFNAAIESGDLALAENLYDILQIEIPEGDEDPFIARLNELRLTVESSNTDIALSTTTMAETTNTALTGVQTDLSDTETATNDLGNTVNLQMPGAQMVFTNFLNAIANGSAPAIGMLVSLATQFSSIKDSVEAIGEASGTGTGEIPGHAVGSSGTRPGMFVAGEQGPELVSSNRSLAVLNNQTTSAIFSAMRSMGGFGGGGVTNTTTTNAPIVNIYPQNGIQLENSISAQVRGFV